MVKILCVCKEGNVRSATLARLLKHRGHETLVVGINRNSQETLKMLVDWSDKTYIVDKELMSKTPQDKKVELFDLGPDIWGIAMHPDLVKKIEDKLKCVFQ